LCGGPDTCCPANSETAGETAAVARCRSHGRSVTCRDFWRFRCRFPTVARDRPLAIVRLSQHVSVPPPMPGLGPFSKKTISRRRMFFRPADWVFDGEWPHALKWFANFRGARDVWPCQQQPCRAANLALQILEPCGDGAFHNRVVPAFASFPSDTSIRTATAAQANDSEGRVATVSREIASRAPEIAAGRQRS
jgi:hypothetical protein